MNMNIMEFAAIVTSGFITGDFQPGEDPKYKELAAKLREDGVWPKEGGLCRDDSGIAEIDITDPVVVEKTRFAHERWVKDVNNEIRMEKIYPLTGSIRKARNGGLYHRGNTHKWHPIWKKADRRLTRHDGKDICRKYHDESDAIGNCWDDDPCYGHWDVESQTFIPDSNDADGFFTDLENFPEEIQEIMIDLRIARENFDDAQKRLMFAKEALDYQTSRLMTALYK